MNIYDYVKKFGIYDFNKKEFNEIDNLILSVVMYLDFTGIVDYKKNKRDLRSVGLDYLHTHNQKEISKLGRAQKDAYKLLKLLIDSKRYKDILLSNYRYISSIDSQFSALTFEIDKKLKFIGFEGTDELLSGWKEDAYMSFKFPVDAQQYAINYINEVVSIFDKNIIVAGHSKGGNLALVATMYSKFYINKKIQKVYSNDGPGLKKEEFESKKYRKIKDKYIHIIPDNSLVGILLKNDSYHVIKSYKKNILCHSASTWLIDNDHFITSFQSKKSKNTEMKLEECLDKIPYSTKELIINNIFSEYEKKGINNINEIKNIKSTINIIKKINKVDIETKKSLIKIIEVIVKEYLVKV